MAGVGWQVTARVPGAGCRGASVLYLPQMGVCGVCMCTYQQTSSWTVQGALDLGRQGPMVSRGTHECGVPIGQVSVLRVCSERQAGPARE